MSKIYKIETIIGAVFIVLVSFFVYKIFFVPEVTLDFNGQAKEITLDDNGYIFKIETDANSVKDFLVVRNIFLTKNDEIIPGVEAKIYPGLAVQINRAAKIKILVDGGETEKYVLGKTVKSALGESQITLSHLDMVEPKLDMPASDGLEITVTRINVEEVIEEEDIEFKKTIKEDSKLGWRETKIEVAGVKGTKNVKYKITYKNGKQISKVKLSQEIIREPQTQVEVQGTYMKLGKANNGQATWYAYKGGMFAASTTIPKGGYAKVTNTATGKSIVVQINDYGPQGKGRIIDLDKVAFQKLASLGAGVIGVKVEQILN